MARLIYLGADQLPGWRWRYRFSLAPGAIIAITSPLSPGQVPDPLVAFGALIDAAPKGIPRV